MGGTFPTPLPRRLGRPLASAKPGSILCIEGQQDVRSRESSPTIILQQPVTRLASPIKRAWRQARSPQGGDGSSSGEHTQAQPTEPPNPPPGLT
jgi:hypothetical protein